MSAKALKLFICGFYWPLPLLLLLVQQYYCSAPHVIARYHRALRISTLRRILNDFNMWVGWCFQAHPYNACGCKPQTRENRARCFSAYTGHSRPWYVHTSCMDAPSLILMLLTSISVQWRSYFQAGTLTMSWPRRTHCPSWWVTSATLLGI